MNNKSIPPDKIISQPTVTYNTEDVVYDQRAWHGTPYNFERFDIGKIGAGVGDQVHGWGLYFVKKMLKNQKSL